MVVFQSLKEVDYPQNGELYRPHLRDIKSISWAIESHTKMSYLVVAVAGGRRGFSKYHPLFQGTSKNWNTFQTKWFVILSCYKFALSFS